APPGGRGQDRDRGQPRAQRGGADRRPRRDRQRRAGAVRRPAGRDRLDQQRPRIGVPEADRRRGLTHFAKETTVLPLIRSEFRKLGPVRGPWLLLAAGPLLVVAGVTGLVQSGGNVHDPAVQNKALAHVALAALFTLIFGIFAVAGEYRHGTVTDTFLSSPGRGRVVTAKLAVYAAVGAAAGAVSSAGAPGGHPPRGVGPGGRVPVAGGGLLAHARRRGGRQHRVRRDRRGHRRAGAQPRRRHRGRAGLDRAGRRHRGAACRVRAGALAAVQREPGRGAGGRGRGV